MREDYTALIVVVFIGYTDSLTISILARLAQLHKQPLVKLSENKERGLIRELSSNSKTTFYPCIVFRQTRPLPEGALRCRWPAADCIVYYRTGGVMGDNCIVYEFYFLVAR